MTRPKLADITQRAEAATDGPWEAWEDDAGFVTRPDKTPDGDEFWIAEGYREPDAAFIAHARTDVPALSAAIRDVLALHTPETPRRDPDFHHTDRVCIECGDPFPCRTYTAITAHIDTTPKEKP